MVRLRCSGSSKEDSAGSSHSARITSHITEYLQATTSYMATVNDDDDDDLQMDGFRISLLFGWHPLVEGMKRLE